MAPPQIHQAALLRDAFLTHNRAAMDAAEAVRNELLARTEAAVDNAAARLELLRVSSGAVPLPSHPRVATPPATFAAPPAAPGSDSESAGYGSGSSYSSRGRLSPRASVHPDAPQPQPQFPPAAATGFAAKRKLLMSLRRRRRELEALATCGTEGERHAALASLPALHTDMHRLYAELTTLQAAARIEEK